jgi:hypothetical protein
LEGYAIAATKNQVFEAILIMMLRSLQAISRAFFMINLPSRVTDKKLMTLIKQILSDSQRAGTTKTFSVEQIVQIVAIACEDPSSSERPISHWTPRELASEAVKRGIVAQISPRSVGRFLKGSHSKTTSPSLLVKP